MKPLQGKRILDLTNVLAGPFCTYQLANLGAEVLKIETPVKGDLARNLGADPDLNSKGMGISFLAQNSGKKSITLNLKSKKGKILFRELVSEYDAVVENFRPGVMKRLDLSYESLKKIILILFIVQLQDLDRMDLFPKTPHMIKLFKAYLV